MRGVGTLFDELDGVPWPTDYPTIVLDHARDRGEVHRHVLGIDAERVRWLFADVGQLFLLDADVSANEPCPHCVLHHLATEPELVEALEDATTAPPADSVLEAVRGRTIVDLAGALDFETAGGRPNLAVVDAASGDVTVAKSIHRHPACDHAALPARERDCHAVESAADLEATFHDPHFGVIRAVADFRKTATSRWFDAFPSFHVTQVQVPNPAYHRFPERHRWFGEAGGPGFSREASRIRGLMEGLERHATLRPAPGDFVASADELDETVVVPTDFYLYSEEQYDRPDFEFTRFDPAEPCEWVRCAVVGTREERTVASDFVYLTPSGETSIKFVHGNSNGCAAHFSVEEAVVGAVTELFERDATMHHWYTRAPRPHVELDSLPEPCRTYARTVSERGYDVVVADGTRYPPFHCFEVFFEARTGGAIPRLVPAAACDTDPEEALRKAFVEALDILAIADVAEPTPLADAADVSTTKDHFNFHQHPDNAGYAEPLLEPETTVPFSGRGTESSRSTIRAALAEHDIEVFYHDLTPTYLARHSVSVVRAVSPDLIPITFGHGHERLAHPTDPVEDDRPADVPHPYP